MSVSPKHDYLLKRVAPRDEFTLKTRALDVDNYQGKYLYCPFCYGLATVFVERDAFCIDHGAIALAQALKFWVKFKEEDKDIDDE